MKVLIVDDHPLIHETLGAMARAAMPGAEIHTDTGLSGALVQARRLHESLELVLLDLGLPGCFGIEALTRFRRAFPNVRVAIISATEDAASVEGAMQAGAMGYIPKTTAPSLMVAALKLIASGGTYLPPQLLPEAPRAPASKKPVTTADLGLTDRQADVLRLVMSGLSNREIAKRLKIAENTVKQHAYSVFKTLGVGSRTEALVALARKGIRLDELKF